MAEAAEPSPMELEQQQQLLDQQEEGQPPEEAQPQALDVPEPPPEEVQPVQLDVPLQPPEPVPPLQTEPQQDLQPMDMQQERARSPSPELTLQAALAQPAAAAAEAAVAAPEPASAPFKPAWAPAAQEATEPAPPEPSQAAPAAIEPAPPGRSKKRGPGGSGGAGGGGASRRSGSEPRDLVHLSGPIPGEALQGRWRPVRLSEDSKAAQIVLDDARLSASSTKGYRMVRGTHGRHEGTWYYEVLIEKLGGTGAARIGWSTGRGEVHAPVGYDIWSYGYRSLEGSKVHAGWRHDFGEAYQEGDVIGCLIHLPPGGQTWEKSIDEAVKHKGKLYHAESDSEEKEPDPDTPPLKGAFVAFTRNGKMQGKAFEDIREGTYYPAISLYTNARTFDEARVHCNFGDAPFAHLPPQLDGWPQPQPVAEMAGSRPEGWSDEREQEQEVQEA